MVGNYVKRKKMILDEKNSKVAKGERKKKKKKRKGRRKVFHCALKILC
jgi:rRNA pseudouridine-1189 N-methylase Emg1 (Nep1/Mra1 family)